MTISVFKTAIYSVPTITCFLKSRTSIYVAVLWSPQASKEGKSQTLIQENSSLENESTVLPHDRVGSDFFWLQTQTAEATSGHPKADELEDEESFLYGKEVAERRDKSGVALFPEFSQNDRNSKPQDTTLADKQRAQTPFSNSGSQRPVSVNLERREYAKVKDIINRQSSAEVRNTVSPASGFPAGTAVNSTMPPMKTSNIQQALESLQSLIKGVSPVCVSSIFPCFVISYFHSICHILESL